ncbi:hypothetical protein HYT84_00240 [Candidatus Micrarchaeota archaeon]|nr:hypothetical protein [Candidatus Micrarchaeota archaeon]
MTADRDLLIWDLRKNFEDILSGRSSAGGSIGEVFFRASNLAGPEHNYFFRLMGIEFMGRCAYDHHELLTIVRIFEGMGSENPSKVFPAPRRTTAEETKHAQTSLLENLRVATLEALEKAIVRCYGCRYIGYSAKIWDKLKEIATEDSNQTIRRIALETLISLGSINFIKGLIDASKKAGDYAKELIPTSKPESYLNAAIGSANKELIDSVIRIFYRPYVHDSVKAHIIDRLGYAEDGLTAEHLKRISREAQVRAMSELCERTLFTATMRRKTYDGVYGRKIFEHEPRWLNMPRTPEAAKLQVRR